MMKKHWTKTYCKVTKNPDGSETTEKFTDVYSNRGYEDYYFNTFIANIDWLLSIKSLCTRNVLLLMMCEAQFNSGEIHLSPVARKRIMARLGIKKQALSRSVSELRAAGIILPQDVDPETGEVIKCEDYLMNPMLFWKGSIGSRQDIIDELNGKGGLKDA